MSWFFITLTAGIGFGIALLQLMEAAGESPKYSFGVFCRRCLYTGVCFLATLGGGSMMAPDGWRLVGAAVALILWLPVAFLIAIPLVNRCQDCLDAWWKKIDTDIFGTPWMG